MSTQPIPRALILLQMLSPIRIAFKGTKRWVPVYDPLAAAGTAGHFTEAEITGPIVNPLPEIGRLMVYPSPLIKGNHCRTPGQLESPCSGSISTLGDQPRPINAQTKEWHLWPKPNPSIPELGAFSKPETSLKQEFDSNAS